jgi:hypothetical protein
MKHLIGITGLAGSGKDTVARMIQHTLPGTEIVSFATPLKEFAEAIFLFPHDWLYGGSELRSRVLVPQSVDYWTGCLGRFWNLAGAFHREWLEACGRPAGVGGSAFVDWFDRIRHECEADPSKLNPRHVLQQLGSDFGRVHIDQDVWAKVAFQRMDRGSAPVYVIPDVRFDNEAQAVLARRGQVWAVIRTRPAGKLDAHMSERGIDPKFVTSTFPNFGSFDSLRDRVREELYYLGLT